MTYLHEWAPRNATMVSVQPKPAPSTRNAKYLSEAHYSAVGDKKNQVAIMNLAREELWNLAQAEQAPATYTCAAMAVHIVNYMVAFDGAATPQASVSGDGGISVEWWVADTSIGIDVDPSGNSEIWVEKDDQPVYKASRSAFTYHESALETAKRYLHEVSAQVKTRAR